jgi:hypothetical protein
MDEQRVRANLPKEGVTLDGRNMDLQLKCYASASLPQAQRLNSPAQ